PVFACAGKTDPPSRSRAGRGAAAVTRARPTASGARAVTHAIRSFVATMPSLAGVPHGARGTLYGGHCIPDQSARRLPPAPAPASRPTDEFKKYFYGLLLICERGTTGLGHIN